MRIVSVWPVEAPVLGLQRVKGLKLASKGSSKLEMTVWHCLREHRADVSRTRVEPDLLHRGPRGLSNENRNRLRFLSAECFFLELALDAGLFFKVSF